MCVRVACSFVCLFVCLFVTFKRFLINEFSNSSCSIISTI